MIANVAGICFLRTENLVGSSQVVLFAVLDFN
jgi:hypothetical protein